MERLLSELKKYFDVVQNPSPKKRRIARKRLIATARSSIGPIQKALKNAEGWFGISLKSVDVDDLVKMWKLGEKSIEILEEILELGIEYTAELYVAMADLRICLSENGIFTLPQEYDIRGNMEKVHGVVSRSMSLEASRVLMILEQNPNEKAVCPSGSDRKAFVSWIRFLKARANLFLKLGRKEEALSDFQLCNKDLRFETWWGLDKKVEHLVYADLACGFLSSSPEDSLLSWTNALELLRSYTPHREDYPELWAARLLTIIPPIPYWEPLRLDCSLFILSRASRKELSEFREIAFKVSSSLLENSEKNTLENWELVGDNSVSLDKKEESYLKAVGVGGPEKDIFRVYYKLFSLDVETRLWARDQALELELTPTSLSKKESEMAAEMYLNRMTREDTICALRLSMNRDYIGRYGSKAAGLLEKTLSDGEFYAENINLVIEYCDYLELFYSLRGMGEEAEVAMKKSNELRLKL